MSNHPTIPPRIARGLYAVCAALFVLGVVIAATTHTFDHAHYGFERWPGFYGLFGFASFVFIVFAAKLLRRLVMRPEDYYGDDRPIDGPMKDL
ncbi:MAG: hypothetical protein AAGC60_12090 [Acidobacteriota bacterium]